MGKKLLSAVLSIALLASAVPAVATSAAADEAMDYGLADSTAEGVILHAFNWSYDTIKENLPAIAQAGYTSVQTSPVQQPKDFCDSKDTSGQWWKLYQPLSFSIGNESWLGTKADLEALCAEAEKYGIKIIADVVSNHMANNQAGDPYTYYADIEKYEPEIFNNTDKYFHQLRRNVDDSKIQYITQGTLDGVPDLNTGDPYVQERVISFLKECIDTGVDGFRFDAAKHIETPEDGEYASDFWPNVIGSATEYAASKGNEIFCYGEILNTPGSGREITDYTQYINVTDNKAGDATLVNVYKKNAEKVVISQDYFCKDDPSNLVLWPESHDTYMGESGSAGLSNTADISNEEIAKAWAIIAARSESTSLYLSRPGVIMGGPADSAWKSTAVSEVNKFHNKFIGKADYVYNDGDVVAVQRGETGVVLVNLGSSADVSVTTQGMADGSYIDAITGNKFTVADGVITGTIGATDIAVVYEGAVTTPKANFSKEDCSFKTETLPVTITLENATSGTYSINGGDPVEFTDSVKVSLGEGAVAGDVITLTVTATDGNITTTETHYYTKEAGTGTGVFVYFDNSTRNFKSVCVYAFYEQKDASGEIIYSTSNGSWPGVIMDYDEESGLYFYELPEDLKVGEACIIFSDGGANQTSQKGHKLSSDCMIYQNNKWQDYNPDGITLMYGDIDNDGRLTNIDALLIMRSLSGYGDLTESEKICADLNVDERINSIDALTILRHLAGYRENDLIGTTFTYGGANTKPEDSDTDTEIDNPISENTFYVVDSAGWIFDYGAKLWLVNNDTNEAIEMIKESPNDDNSRYSYCDLPEGWTNLSVYRTAFDASDISDAYNTWNCGTITDSCNAYKLTGDGSGVYTTYDPNAALEYMPRTIYFDNSLTKWDEVYIHGWGASGLNSAYVQMELVEGTDNIYTYTFDEDIEAGAKTFLFTAGEEYMGRKRKQTVDVAGEAGKDFFKVTTVSNSKWLYEWSVYGE